MNDDLPEDHGVVTRFEDAWRRGERPDLAALLPAGAARAASLRELVHVELELRLKAGEAARVEDYLARFPELAADAAAVASLVRSEHAHRVGRDPWMAPDELRARFPGVALDATEEDAEGSTCDAAGPPAGVTGARRATVAGGGPVPGYTILRELGRGHNGVVFLARDAAARRKVLLRIFPGGRPDVLPRARAAAQSSTLPGFVPLQRVVQAGENIVLQWPFVEGGTLAERLAHGPLAPAEAGRLVLDLAETMQGAHDAGVAHGKLTPGNVFPASGGREPPVPEARTGGSRPPLALIADLGLHTGTPAGDVASLQALLRACVGVALPTGLAALADAPFARAADLAAGLRRWLAAEGPP